MENSQELLKDVEGKMGKIPFITKNGRTGIVLRQYHWTIKSQINVVTEALKDIVEGSLFILGETGITDKYLCMEPTINNIVNYIKIKLMVEEALKLENERVQRQIEEVALLHSKNKEE